MKKTGLSFLLLAMSLVPNMLMANRPDQFTTQSDILVPPAIAENGTSYIFMAKRAVTKVPSVFVSRQLRSGDFSKPVFAFDLNIVPEGLSEHFKNFNPSKPSPGWTGFESPTIQNNIIAFGGTLESRQRGVFCAQKVAGKWRAFPLALQGQADKNGNVFQYFNSPYITTGRKAIFLATMEKGGNKNDTYNAIYSCKIRRFLKPSPPELLAEANEQIFNFDDISVAQIKFATRADTDAGTEEMFIYDGSGQLIKTVPKRYRVLERGGAPVELGGPTYYADKIAFFAHSFDKNNIYISAIYCNAGGNKFSKPIVYTGTEYKISGVAGYTTFSYKVSNPTLFLKGDKATVAFMGHPKPTSKANGVYLAAIKDGKVKLSAIAVPDQILPHCGKIKDAQTGAVSLRHGKIPVMLTLTDGTVKIGVINAN